jgi:hypothetical protein
VYRLTLSRHSLTATHTEGWPNDQFALEENATAGVFVAKIDPDLADARAAFVTGQCIFVDGGKSLPG